jgi:hypothetical protein
VANVESYHRHHRQRTCRLEGPSTATKSLLGAPPS